MIPVRKELVGDVAKCARHMPNAVSRARFLHSIKQYQSQKWVADGVIVEIYVTENDLLVRITALCFPYLEAGALGLDNVNFNYMKDVTTSKIYKAGLTDIDDAALKYKLPNGDPYESKIYKLKDPPTELPVKPPPQDDDFRDPVTGAVNIADRNCAQYPDQCELRKKKLALAYLNPSKGTGKMRMFLQAFCGSKLMNRLELTLDRYRWQVTKVKLDTYLEINPKCYIVRDANGEYWMIYPWLGAAYLMTFTPCADAVKSKLNKGGLSREQESKLEAYLFSQFVVRPPTSEELERVRKLEEKNPGLGAIEPTIPGWYPIGWWSGYSGEPWHFAYQKAEAVRVRNAGKSAAPPGQPGLEWYWYEGFLEVMTFHTSADAPDALPSDAPEGTPVPDPSPKPPTVTVSVKEQAEWSPNRSTDFMWYIDPVKKCQFTEDTFYLRKNDQAMDGPVFAMYDKDDAHIIVRHKRTLQSGETTTVTLSDYDLCSCGTMAQRTTYPGGYSHGFYVTGAVKWMFKGRYEPSVAEQEGTNSRSGGGGGGGAEAYGPTDCASIYSGGCSNGAYTQYRAGLDDQSCTAWTKTFTAGAVTGKADYHSGYDWPLHFFCPALDNPDAFYIGEQEVEYRNNWGTTSVAQGGGSVTISGGWGGTPSGNPTQEAPCTPYFGGIVLGYGVDEESFTSTYQDVVRLVTQHHNILISNEHNRSSYWQTRRTSEYFGDWTFYKMFNRVPLDGYTVTLLANESINGRLWYGKKPDLAEPEFAVAGQAPDALKDDVEYFIGYA